MDAASQVFARSATELFARAEQSGRKTDELVPVAITQGGGSVSIPPRGAEFPSRVTHHHATLRRRSDPKLLSVFHGLSRAAEPPAAAGRDP